MMSPFEAYQLFVAVRQHMTTDSYDINKFNGKVKASIDNFKKRNDKYMFEKLARLPNNRLRVASTLVEGGQWIGDVIGQKGETALNKHLRAIESIGYHFSQQLKLLDSSKLKDIFHSDRAPMISQMFHQGKLSLETMVLLNKYLQFVDVWKSKFADDPTIQDLCKLINKFTAFVPLSKRAEQQISATIMQWVSANNS